MVRRVPDADPGDVTPSGVDTLHGPPPAAVRRVRRGGVWDGQVRPEWLEGWPQ